MVLTSTLLSPVVAEKIALLLNRRFIIARVAIKRAPHEMPLYLLRQHCANRNRWPGFEYQLIDHCDIANAKIWERVTARQLVDHPLTKDAFLSRASFGRKCIVI